jgi:hypothetical protein
MIWIEIGLIVVGVVTMLACLMFLVAMVHGVKH